MTVPSNFKGILRDYILYYIACFVVKKLTKDTIDCVKCKAALFKSTSDHNYCITETLLYEQFVRFKNRGGLISASRDVFLIVKECETRVFPFADDLQNLKISKIILQVQRKFIELKSVFENLDCDSESFQNHKLTLIERVGALYLKIRIHSHTHWKNTKKVSKRKARSKAVLQNND